MLLLFIFMFATLVLVMAFAFAVIWLTLGGKKEVSADFNPLTEANPDELERYLEREKGSRFVETTTLPFSRVEPVEDAEEPNLDEIV